MARTARPSLLSNFHVLAGPGVGLGDPIAQPGPLDDADEDGARVGVLRRRHLSLAGDGALCSIEGRGIDERILGLEVAPRRPAIAERQDKVVKSGRTTGITHGVVTRSEVIATVSYPQGERGIGGFEIEANPDLAPAPGGIVEKGDSGSLWLIDAAAPEGDIAVGIQVSGVEDPAEQREIAFACHLHSVLAKLAVTLVRAP
jgi:endonuclease G